MHFHGRARMHLSAIFWMTSIMLVAVGSSCTSPAIGLRLRGGSTGEQAASEGDGLMARGRSAQARDPRGLFGEDEATSLASRIAGLGVGGSHTKLRVAKRCKRDASICTLDTKMIFQRKGAGADVKGPAVLVRQEKFRPRESSQSSKMVHSADGKVTSQIEVDGASVYSAATGELVFECRGPQGSQVQGIHLSPRGTFLITCTRHGPRKVANGDGGEGHASATWTHQGAQGGHRTSEVFHGLAVWDIVTGVLRATFGVPLAFSPEAWPYIQWTGDEQIALRKTQAGFDMITFEGMAEQGGATKVSKVLEGSTTQVWMTRNVISCEGMDSCKKVAIAAYVGGKLFGQDAHDSQLRIFEYPGGMEAPVVTVGLGQAEECTVKWSYDGSALLVLSNVVVDDTNDNYYGKTRLQFVTLDDKIVSTVKLDKDGPVHDAAWCPTRQEFIVIYGKMPARAVLFNHRGVPSFSLGAGPYNVVIWSPHGRFFVLGGFGNLPGRMQFWDKTTKVKLGESSSPCAIYKSFSPCSRFLLTAVTFPSLRVDNELRIWKYDGTPLYHEENVEELYQCEWLPSADGTWDDRSASPDVLARAAEQAAKTKLEASAGAAGGLAGATQSQKAAMMGQTLPSWGRMGSFRLHDPGEDKADVGVVDAEAQNTSRGRVRGGVDAPFGSVAALSKAQKKRLAKKRAQERKQAGGDAGGEAEGGEGDDGDE